MANITLSNDGLSTSTDIRVLGGKIRYGWKNLVTAEPGDAYYGTTEVQFTGWENPVVTLDFYIPAVSPPSGTMTWALWNEFVKNRYDGTSGTQTNLGITVGSSTLFTDYSASTSLSGNTSIPVQIINYNVSIDADASKDGEVYSVTAQLKVTK